jgi:hypothetical protein
MRWCRCRRPVAAPRYAEGLTFRPGTLPLLPEHPSVSLLTEQRLLLHGILTPSRTPSQAPGGGIPPFSAGHGSPSNGQTRIDQEAPPTLATLRRTSSLFDHSRPCAGGPYRCCGSSGTSVVDGDFLRTACTIGLPLEETAYPTLRCPGGRGTVAGRGRAVALECRVLTRFAPLRLSCRLADCGGAGDRRRRGPLSPNGPPPVV